VSAHLPCDEEGKFLEFDIADFGILGLQTAFASIRTATENVLTIEKLIEKFTINPRKILQLKPTKIAIEEQAKLTLFDENAEFILTKKDIVSPSKNTPFINKTLKGKVIRCF
jgi:dihydroorotase